jgi:hypothetical protein
VGVADGETCDEYQKPCEDERRWSVILTASVEKDQDWLLLQLFRSFPENSSPDIQRETILALWSPSTTSESVNDALSLGREAREVN